MNGLPQKTARNAGGEENGERPRLRSGGIASKVSLLPVVLFHAQPTVIRNHYCFLARHPKSLTNVELTRDVLSNARVLVWFMVFSPLLFRQILELCRL